MWDSLFNLKKEELTEDLVRLYIPNYGITDLLYQLRKLKPNINSRCLIVDTIIKKIVEEYNDIPSGLAICELTTTIFVNTYVCKFHDLETRDTFNGFLIEGKQDDDKINR